MPSSVWSDVLHSSEESRWRTPLELFEVLDREFGFELDAAADDLNALCPYWFDEACDGLSQDWNSPTTYRANALEVGPCPPPPWETVWLNPPYGRHSTPRWIEKAWKESRAGLTVVCLVMACTETAWWHDLVSRATQVRFLRRRLHFKGPDGKTGPAPKGSAVVVFTPWWTGPPQFVLWDHSERL